MRVLLARIKAMGWLENVRPDGETEKNAGFKAKRRDSMRYLPRNE
jgi:hypothetical protein